MATVSYVEGRAVNATNTSRPEDDLMVQYAGRWMTYAEFEKARLDVLMPRQPKREWGKR